MNATHSYAEFVAAVDGEPAADWLTGTPMDPTAATVEPMPALPGFPFLHAGSGAVIVGPTGGGRSSLIQAGLYDAARGGLRCAYLGSEVAEPEFNARAAILAQRRGDEVDDELLTGLARARYLNLASIIAQGWSDPAAWVEGIVARYDLLAVDPLSAVASALDLDFDKSNAEFIRFYDRLVQPLTDSGVTTIIVENVGHAIEAKGRAKGVSAKQDRADLTFSCALSANPVGLIVKAGKVRSVRAPIVRGDEWMFHRDTQTIEAKARGAGGVEATPAFRPTFIMEKVSRIVERDPGLTRNAILTAVGGRKPNATLALQLLVSEGYVEARKDGQAHRHYSVKPFQDYPETNTGSTGSIPGPHRVPDPVQTTGSTGSHTTPTVWGDRDPVAIPPDSPNWVHSDDADAEALR